jgi:hypothetical protein
MTEPESTFQKLPGRRCMQMQAALALAPKLVLPPFRNIRCFSFVKKIYLDIF